jgi:hypothetical protein
MMLTAQIQRYGHGYMVSTPDDFNMTGLPLEIRGVLSIRMIQEVIPTGMHSVLSNFGTPLQLQKMWHMLAAQVVMFTPTDTPTYYDSTVSPPMSNEKKFYFYRKS